MKKNQSKNLPTLVDQDIVTANPIATRGLLSKGKLSTVAIALSIAALSAGCEKSDSDTTKHADASSTYYDSNSFDPVQYIADGDQTISGDSK